MGLKITVDAKVLDVFFGKSRVNNHEVDVQKVKIFDGDLVYTLCAGSEDLSQYKGKDVRITFKGKADQKSRTGNFDGRTQTWIDTSINLQKSVIQTVELIKK